MPEAREPAPGPADAAAPDAAATEPAAAGAATDHTVTGAGSITREQVAHLARLSRLALGDDELDSLASELGVILAAVAAIGEVADATDVPPTTHAVPVENVTRPDVVTPSLPRDRVLAGAPEAEDGRFRVPRILDAE